MGGDSLGDGVSGSLYVRRYNEPLTPSPRESKSFQCIFKIAVLDCSRNDNRKGAEEAVLSK